MDTTKNQAPEKVTNISKTCDKHGEYIAKTTKAGSGKFIREFETMCPFCEKEEKQQRQEKVVAMCEKQRSSDYRSGIKNTGIPKRYMDIKLESIIPSNEKQKIIIERCKKYIEKFKELKELGTSLVFTGRPGTGKTHIALSMIDGLVSYFCEVYYNKNIKEVEKAGSYADLVSFRQPCLYINTYDLFAKIKSTYNKNSEKTEIDIINKYSTVDVLIIDEVGVQAGSDYESMIMFRIINSRYENMKPTFIISNLSEKDLSEYVGERTIDRFYENNGAVFIFDWESERRSK